MQAAIQHTTHMLHSFHHMITVLSNISKQLLQDLLISDNYTDHEVKAQLCLCKYKSMGASGRPVYGTRTKPMAASNKCCQCCPDLNRQQ